MEIIIEKLDENIYLPDSFLEYVTNKKICFFDIETTGFNRSKDKVILIGLLYIDNNNIIIKQYFGESLEDELEVLNSFINDISKFDKYINFNGDLFDIPFLNTKFNMYDIDFTLDKKESIDLLKIVKKYKSVLNYENYKLKTIEKNLGILRDDKISGKESVDLYYRYINSKDNDIKEIILRHNYDDIYYLPKILKVFDIIYEKTNFNYAIPFKNNILSIKINTLDIDIKENTLNVYATTDNTDLLEQIYYDNYYNLKWTPSKGEMLLQVQIYSGKLSNNNSCYYLNKDNFNFRLNTLDNTDYSFPDNIILIKENNKLIYSNLTNILEEIFINILSNI